MSGFMYGKSEDSIIRDLLEHPQGYEFSMVVQLLKSICRGGKIKIRTKPALTLGFNANDVASIKCYSLNKPVESIDNRVHFYAEISSSELLEEASYGDGVLVDIEVNFLGLFGSSSPLPVYYTERLIKDVSDDNFSTVDFVSMINEVIYHQYLLANRKYRIFNRIVESQDERLVERIMMFAGMSLPVIRKAHSNPYIFFPYLGIFSMMPRSTEGLQTILRREVNKNITVSEYTIQTVDIPAEQLNKLGVACSTLGEDCYLGTKVRTADVAITVNIVCRTISEYERIVTGGDIYQRIKEILRAYMIDRIDVIINVSYEVSERDNIKLGNEHGKLGMNTVLYSGCRQKIVFKYDLDY